MFDEGVTCLLMRAKARWALRKHSTDFVEYEYRRR